MKFGVSASMWAAERDGAWPARLELIARCGFDGVELRVHEPLDLHSLRDVRRHLEQLGLEATVAGAATSSVPIDHHVRRLVDVCAVLDAHVLCGPFPFASDRESIAALARVAAYARDSGVTLALGGLDHDAEHRTPTIADMSRLVDAAGASNVGVLYNTYQAHVEESSVAGAILSAGNRLRHVQVADNDGVAPGAGQVRWSETFAALDAVRYDDWYVVDAKCDEDDEAIQLAGLHFLQRHRPRAARA